jgi:hypothetical protein
LEFLSLKALILTKVPHLVIHALQVLKLAVDKVVDTAAEVVEEALLLLTLVKHLDHQKFLQCI